MMEEHLLTVGELSKLTGVSKQAIRYYDSIGLLKPSKLGSNGYRYYEPMDVLYLNSIMRLTQLGCSLEETRRYISGRDINDVRKMMAIRKELTEVKIKELQKSLDALCEQMAQVEEGLIIREIDGVHIRMLPDRYFVYLESSETPGLKQGIMQIGLLVRQLDEKGLLYVGNPVFEIYQNHTKAGYFLKAPLEGFAFDVVPEGGYACATHRGSYADIKTTIDKLKAHLKEQGLSELSGVYQLFLIDYALVQSDDELVTEVQIRVT